MSSSAEAVAAVAVACPTCGALAVAGDLFCEACGADLPFTGTPELPLAATPLATDTPAAPPPSCASCGAEGVQVVDGYCGVCGMKQPSPRDHVEVVVGEPDAPAAAAATTAAGVSDRGRRHRRNEDAFALSDMGGRVVAVVCDGVSTTVAPDEASERAAEAALAVLSVEDTGLLVAYAAARAAVEAIEWAPQPDLGPPSCTFLAAWVEGLSVRLAAMGDCRTFWLPHDGDAEVLTEDDSWAAEQVATGRLADEVYADSRAHTITRWLGCDADPSWQPRLVEFDAPGPGRLVLASDGLWNHAPEGPDLAAAAGTGDPLAVARRLVTFANDRGGHDNITAVVIDIAEPAPTEPAPTEPAPTEPAPTEPSKGPMPS